MRREERFAVGARPSIEIDLASGSLEVVAGQASDVRVSADASSPNDLEIVQIGNTVAVRHSPAWLGRRAVRMLVEVPAGAALSIKTASMDVALRGSFGDVRCRTASGDVQLDDAERLDVVTASGDVRARLVHGEADFNTASGDVTVTTAGGRLTAQLASGDLSAERVGAVVDVGTATGDVRIGRCDGSEINIKTVSGDIVLGLPAGIRVHPDISTMSGKVLLPSATSASGQSTPDSVQGERRAVRLRLRTVSGDVRIRRVD